MQNRPYLKPLKPPPKPVSVSVVLGDCGCKVTLTLKKPIGNFIDIRGDFANIHLEYCAEHEKTKPTFKGK